MSATVGTPAEQSTHRDPPPPPQPNAVVAEPATVAACQADFYEAHRPIGGSH